MLGFNATNSSAISDSGSASYLYANATVNSNVSATFTILPQTFSSNVSATSTASGSFSTAIHCNSNVQIASNATSQLTTKIVLQSAVNATTNISETITTEISLNANPLIISEMIVDFSVSVRFSAFVQIASNVGATLVSSEYYNQVIQDGATYYWRLNDSTNTILDSVDGNIGINVGTDTLESVALKLNDTSGSILFDGATSYIYTSDLISPPQYFSIECIIETSTTSGGKIVGFGNSQTGLSTVYDRHVWIDDNGYVWFGTYTSQTNTISSLNPLNDSVHHHIVASLTADGMLLYVDGLLQSTNPTTTGQTYTGYWRIAYDNLNGWSPTPSSFYFEGNISDVAIYDSPLTQAQIQTHYYIMSQGAGGHQQEFYVNAISSANASAQILTEILLKSNAIAQTNITDFITTDITLSANPVVSTALSHNLTTEITFNSNPSFTTNASGAIQTKILLDCNAYIVSNSDGVLYTEIVLYSNANALSITNANLDTAIEFNQLVNIVSNAHSTLTTEIPLSANLVANTALSKALTTTIGLDANLNVTSSASGAFLVIVGKWAIGFSALSFSDLTSNGYVGKMSDLAIYSSVLSQPQIDNHYNIFKNGALASGAQLYASANASTNITDYLHTTIDFTAPLSATTSLNFVFTTAIIFNPISVDLFTTNLAGNISTKIYAYSDINVISNLTGILDTEITLDSAINSASSATANLSFVAQPFESNATALSTASANITTSIDFVSNINSTSSVTCSLSTEIYVNSNINVTSNVTSNLETQITLDSALSVSSQSVAEIETNITLDSNINATSNGFGTLRNVIDISANANSNSASSAALTTEITFDSAIDVALNVTALLGNYNLFISNVYVASNASANLTTSITLEAAVSASSEIVGRVSETTYFESFANVLSTCAASLTTSIEFSANFVSVTEVSAPGIAYLAQLAAAMNATSAVNANINTEIALSSNCEIISFATGLLIEPTAFYSNATSTVTSNSALTTFITLESNADAISNLVGEIVLEYFFFGTDIRTVFVKSENRIRVVPAQNRVVIAKPESRLYQIPSQLIKKLINTFT